MAFSFLLTAFLLRVLALSPLDHVNAFPSTGLNARATPALPSNDPFYSAPWGYEHAAPGHVFRSRPVTLALNGLVPLPGTKGYQVLYRTTGSVDNIPFVTVTTIFVPGNADHSKLVGYATPEDADNINCAPSYNFQEGSNNTDSTASDVAQIELYLLKGWIVSSPDYEGPQSSYGAGKVSGYSVLDGLRATINFLGLKNPSVAIYGYSGGAIATGWAAALAPSYARELRIVGAATGGTPANLVLSMYHLVSVDDGLFTGLVFVSIPVIATLSIF
jgi:hypothetical protein